jgi:hypothetical protein
MADELVSRTIEIHAIAQSSVALYAGTVGAVLQQLVGALQFFAYAGGLLFLREVRKQRPAQGSDRTAAVLPENIG